MAGLGVRRPHAIVRRVESHLYNAIRRENKQKSGLIQIIIRLVCLVTEVSTPRNADQTHDTLVYTAIARRTDLGNARASRLQRSANAFFNCTGTK